MHNIIGGLQVGVEFEFLNRVLTERGILEQSLDLTQEIKITDVTYYPEKKLLIFDCDILQGLYH